jgi:GrpB-like predicted nucleotidyltransferase (UPF0157 family)
MRTITVVDHDASWSEAFQRLRDRIWPVVADVAVAIEHVGSTAVPGLAAKPVIDLDVVLRSGEDLPRAVERLATLGYAHRGDLGIAGREAFAAPPGPPEHHLYVCPPDSPALANHLALREHLRAHPEVAAAYGALKRRLAAAFPHDIDGYVAGKTGFILGVLRAAGFPEDQLEEIERANRRLTP